MKGKSVAFQIIATLVLVAGAYMSNFNPSIQEWIGVFVFAGTLLLHSPILSSGSLPQGWSWVVWASNLGAITLQVGSYLSEHSLVDPSVLNGVMIGVNLFLSTWVKDYGSGSMVK